MKELVPTSIYHAIGRATARQYHVRLVAALHDAKEVTRQNPGLAPVLGAAIVLLSDLADLAAKIEEELT